MRSACSRRQAANGFVVAGEEDGRHRSALPIRAGRVIVGVFEQAGGEALLLRAFGGAHDAGQQADAGIEQHQRGRSPPEST